MIYYEMLILLTPDISPDNYDLVKEKISGVIVENGGVIKNYDRWGKYLLAYPIKKHTYGIYVLLRFGVGLDLLNIVLTGIRSLCILRFNLIIMRHVFVRLGKVISETYCRPDSLEDAPRREKSYDIEEVISRKSRYNKKDDSNQYIKNFDGAVLGNDNSFIEGSIVSGIEKNING
jgi:small subunit ribosomal protein S6